MPFTGPFLAVLALPALLSGAHPAPVHTDLFTDPFGDPVSPAVGETPLAPAPGASLAAGDTLLARLREEAGLLGRGGEIEEARDRLLRLHRDAPDDRRTFEDLIAVMGWLGDDAGILALTVETGRETAELSADVLEAVARALRNTGRPVHAAALYGTVMTRHPERWGSRIGRALSLGEAGDPEGGFETLAPLLEESPPPVDALIAAGHLRSAQRRNLEAALHYDRAAGLDPENPEAIRGRALALSALGGTHRASEIARGMPHLFSPAEREEIEGNRAAAIVRWMELPVHEEENPFRRVDEAVAALEERNEVDFEGLPDHRNRARFDRMVALAARGEAERVVTELEEMEEEGIEFPPFIHRIRGDMLLALRRPEEAERSLRSDLEVRPDNLDTRVSLFYALLEQERFGPAMAMLDSVLATQPPFRWGDGLRTPIENPDRFRLDVTRLLGLSFAGRLAEGEKGFAAMVNRAPVNISARSEFSTILRFRGRPRAALEQAELALPLDPVHLGLRHARAAALLDLHDWRRAEAAIDSLAADFPLDRRVRELRREEGLRRGWTLRGEGEWGEGSGSAIGTEDRSHIVTLLTPLSGGGLRGMARLRRRDARFDGGWVRHDRVEAGAGLDRRGGWLTLLGGMDREGGDRAGIVAEGGRRWNDALSTSLAVETRSFRIPLQARLAGVDGWSAALDLTATPHEGRRVALEVAHASFEDGNRRWSLLTGFDQRLLTTPHFRFAGKLEGYASRNSRENAPYFNPGRDGSISVGADAEWITWRRYARAFTQHLALWGGAYAQEGHGTSPTFSLLYEHLWSLGPAVSLRYGIGHQIRNYDANREERTALLAGLEWRIR